MDGDNMKDLDIGFILGFLIGMSIGTIGTYLFLL